MKRIVKLIIKFINMARTKIIKEKNCEVSYKPEVMFMINYPGEYIDFEEL